MTDINALAERVACHLAGRPVVLRWQNPPSASAVGQVCKTGSGGLIVYVGNLTSVDARFRVLLHEIAHCRLDASWMPKSNDHKRPAGSVKQSDAARQAWRQDPREKRADRLGDEWFSYAEKHAYKYWRVGRSEMECKLLSLLDWS